MQRSHIVQRVSENSAGLPQEWHPVLRRVFGARGVRGPDDVDTSLAGLHRAELLGGIERAVGLLADCLREERLILIVGDFDADGATATALAVRALKAMGATRVDYLVPNRFEFGYGLTPEIVDLAARRHPHLIVTVDNGISSLEGVAQAARAGIEVLVTDHHLPGAALPAAAAIVNPNLGNDKFPSKNLAGVGVIFYVMTALRAHLRESAWFAERGITEPRLADLLDLVALGTVADVVSLDHNNRRLVEQGIARIRAGHCQPGISALIDAAGRSRARITTSDLGFAVAPRLNAAGRLADMSLGIECLLSDDANHCAAIADQLDALNRERREIEGEMRGSAFALIEATLPASGAEEAPAGLCVFHEDWHQGVVGIVAARVKDRFHRPVIAFAATDEHTLKGSARSIPGLHIRDTLELVATRNPGLIERFGGHAMAAGLSLRRAEYQRFTHAFIAAVETLVDDAARRKIIYSDGPLAEADYSFALARTLLAAAPWGQGFPEPRFDGVFVIEDRRVVGADHARLVLRPREGSTLLGAIAFGAAGESWFRDAAEVRAVFKLDINEFRGNESLQLVIDYAETLA